MEWTGKEIFFSNSDLTKTHDIDLDGLKYLHHQFTFLTLFLILLQLMLISKRCHSHYSPIMSSVNYQIRNT